MTERFELLDHIPDGCVVVSDLGTVLYWNAVLEARTGMPRATLVGRCLYDVFPHLAAPRFRSRIEQTLSLGAPAVLSALLTAPFFPRSRDDGRRRFEQVTVTRLAKRAGAPYQALITIRDVTEQYDRGTKFHDQFRRANAETALRRAQARELEAAIATAESATRAKSLFLASMSHELRTPMNGVLGMADILLHSELTPWQRENVEVLQASASSLLTVLNDVLDFSKIEADKLELESIAFDPRAVVEESVVLVAELAHAKNVECAAIIEPGVPAKVLGDPTRVRQVLMNLLSNAIKFTSQGEVVVTLKVLGDEGSSRLCCEVRDTGGGISPATCARLFEPFTQASASTSRSHGGTGLGLSICRRLMRLMGGDIVAESELGHGSVFRFEMPLRSVPDAAIAVHAAAPRTRVGILLSHQASAHAVRAQLANLGAHAQLVSASDLPDLGAGLTHLIVDSATSATSGIATSTWPGIALILATRPVSSRGNAPPGFRGILPMPCRSSSVEQALSLVSQRGVTRPEPSRAIPMRVLVAEDDRTNQIVARSMLKRLGCTVDVVSDGRAAVEAAMASSYDLILMDMQMPEMGGCDAAATLRRAGYAGPIVALTASVLANEQMACLAAGMNEVLTKPLDSALLRATLLRFEPAVR